VHHRRGIASGATPLFHMGEFHPWARQMIPSASHSMTI
jgi:hypothetical protein